MPKFGVHEEMLRDAFLEPVPPNKRLLQIRPQTTTLIQGAQRGQEADKRSGGVCNWKGERTSGWGDKAKRADRQTLRQTKSRGQKKAGVWGEVEADRQKRAGDRGGQMS